MKKKKKPFTHQTSHRGFVSPLALPAAGGLRVVPTAEVMCVTSVPGSHKIVTPLLMADTSAQEGYEAGLRVQAAILDSSNTDPKELRVASSPQPAEN